MDVRRVGTLSNCEEAVREVRHIYPDAPSPGMRNGEITEEMIAFMEELLRTNHSRALFLWLLKVTLDITAPVYWWNQGAEYFPEVEWVRRHPVDATERELLRQDDFEGGVPSLLLETMNEQITSQQRSQLADTLPDNFYRRGYVHTNYGGLRELYRERGHYNQGHWKALSEYLKSLPYATLLTTGV